MIPPRIAQDIQRQFDQAVSAGSLNSMDVKLVWETTVAPDLSFLSEVPVPTWDTETVKAMVHFITPEQVQRRGYVLLGLGDALVDFPSSVTLSGRAGIRFIIDGKVYIQKTNGDAVMEWNDTVVDGVEIWKTIAMELSQQKINPAWP